MNFFTHCIINVFNFDKLHKIKLPILAKSHAISSHTVKVMAKKLVKM